MQTVGLVPMMRWSDCTVPAISVSFSVCSSQISSTPPPWLVSLVVQPTLLFEHAERIGKSVAVSQGCCHLAVGEASITYVCTYVPVAAPTVARRLGPSKGSTQPTRTWQVRNRMAMKLSVLHWYSRFIERPLFDVASFLARRYCMSTAETGLLVAEVTFQRNGAVHLERR